MKASARLFLFLAAFDGGAAILYAAVGGEQAGLTLLFLAAGLHGIIGGYLLMLSRRFAVAPEDRADAEMADGAGPLGFFSPGSVWPFAVGLSATLLLVGMVYTPLAALAGGVFLTTSVVGMVSEHWRTPR
jgi:hypothetical protein